MANIDLAYRSGIRWFFALMVIGTAVLGGVFYLVMFY